MSAYLKEIKIPDYEYDTIIHRISMIFANSMDSEELYNYETTIETQYCTKDEWKNCGLSKDLLDEKLKFAKSLVGKVFNVNLYYFTVKELTNGRYEAFEVSIDKYFYYDIELIEDYHIASYMTKEDVVNNLKYSICIQGTQGSIKGVLPDKSTEEITADLFFSRPVPEQKIYEIPYNEFTNLNSNYIVNEASIMEIQKGHYLANQIKGCRISESDFNSYLKQIREYRSKVKAVKNKNESWRKKIFFWEPKETVEELTLYTDFKSFAIDCIILYRKYPEDCEEAKIKYSTECERELRKTYMNEDVDKNWLKDEMREFLISLHQKYKNKSVLRPVS